MSAIFVLVGPLASGKSTYARVRADEGALVVCHDELARVLHGGAYRDEIELRECYRWVEEEIALRALQRGRDVVVDSDHLTAESRARWVTFGRSYGVPVVAVVFPATFTLVHARRRFAADPRGRPYEEWLDVARRHAEQARREPLDWEAEGFSALKVEGDRP